MTGPGRASSRGGILAAALLAAGCSAADRTVAPNDSRLTAQGEAFAENQWKYIPPLPAGGDDLTSVLLPGACVWAMGDGTTAVNTICNTTPPPSSWSSGPALPVALHSLAGAGVIGGKIYVAGGLDVDDKFTAGLYVYSAAGGWVLDAEPIPFKVGCGGATVVNRKLYVFASTPLFPDDPTPCLSIGYINNVFAVYDPALPTPPRWRMLTSGPSTGYGAYGSIAAVGSTIYAAASTSYTYGFKVDSVDVFDVTAETWRTPIDFPMFHRWGGAVVAAHDRIYYIGGFNGHLDFDPSRIVSVFDPSTSSWDEARPLQDSRRIPSAVAGGNKIAVVGSTSEWITLGSGAGACDSHEPDDLATQATPWRLFDQGSPNPWAPYGEYGPPVTQARVCSATDTDYFSVGQYNNWDGTVGVQLLPPPGADYKLELLDATGTQVLATSDNPGSVSETIDIPFTPGLILLLRVSSQNGSFDRVNPYRLEQLP
ncbi:MAG: hypothetical protein ABI877_20610 [Gemmatimonadaceae bacterium]